MDFRAALLDLLKAKKSSWYLLASYFLLKILPAVIFMIEKWLKSILDFVLG